jgi:thymidylate synthase
LAEHCGLEAYEFVYFMGNCHIYEEHIDAAKLQVTREPLPFPTLSITQVRENINDYQVFRDLIYIFIQKRGKNRISPLF